MYNVDGDLLNRWDGSGMCYCEHCQKNFKAFSGLDLPRTSNPQDPARRQYIVWRQERLFELWRLWDGEIRKINPNASYIANAGGGALSDLDMKTHRRIGADVVRRSPGAARVHAAVGRMARTARSTARRWAARRSAGSSAWAWKSLTAGKTRCRAAMKSGCGWPTASPTIFARGSRSSTARSSIIAGLKVVEDLYSWHYKNERYLRNEQSLARVAMVYSQQTATFYGGEQARAKVEDHALGFYQALVEARIPFDMVHDRMLDPAHIGRYRTLILPNIAALSSEQCRQLDGLCAAAEEA